MSKNKVGEVKKLKVELVFQILLSIIIAICKRIYLN